MAFFRFCCFDIICASTKAYYSMYISIFLNHCFCPTLFILPFPQLQSVSFSLGQHSSKSSLDCVYVFASGPKSSFLLELGPCLWGFGAGHSQTPLHTSAESWQEWDVQGFALQIRSYTLGRSAGIHTLILIQPSAFGAHCHC